MSWRKTLGISKRYSVDYPVVIDTEGDIARLFAVDGMPSGYLPDAEGRVRDSGFKRGDELKLAESIKKCLQKWTRAEQARFLITRCLGLLD